MFYSRYIIYLSGDKANVTNNPKFIGKFLAEFSADLKGFSGMFYIGDIPLSITNGKVRIKKSIPNIPTLRTKLFIKNIFLKTDKGTKHYSKSQLIRHNIAMRDILVKDRMKSWADKFNEARNI
jgi:hypothetical protein